MAAAQPGLWELDGSSLGLSDGIYHYWFNTDDTSPAGAGALLVTDPIAYTVDYRLMSAPGYQPAAVIKLENGGLVPCDPGGETADLGAPPEPYLPSSEQSSGHLRVARIVVTRRNRRRKYPGTRRRDLPRCPCALAPSLSWRQFQRPCRGEL
jgi:hypothetical protein